MIVRYNSIVTSVKKKDYDLLDHRKGEITKMPIVKVNSEQHVVLF